MMSQGFKRGGKWRTSPPSPLAYPDLELSPSPQNCSRDSWKLLFFINWLRFMIYWDMVKKIYSEMHPVLCTNTHYGITDLVYHGIFKNTKTQIPWEQNITFIKQKNLNMCCGWHILRSYCFVLEVTFKAFKV